MPVNTLITALNLYYMSSAPATKAGAIAYLVKHLGLLKPGRSVYMTPDASYAVRFCYAGKPSFSNVILSLRTLLEFDHLPFIVCVIRDYSFELFLANTTFLAKISHSSHLLAADNIRGSFLGNDILKFYNHLQNAPENFDELFAIHQAMSRSKNISRLIGQTTAIVPVKAKLPVTPEAESQIKRSIELIFAPVYQTRMLEIKQKLDMAVRENTGRIIESALQEPENVNLRGNAIEQIITGQDNRHNLDDYTYAFTDGIRALIDIKTSIADYSSSPKHYNIDKLLEELSDGRTLALIYVVYIDPSARTIMTNLINNFDSSIIWCTRIQFHWAGRNSRGVTQLDARLHALFAAKWHETFDRKLIEAFIQNLVNL